MILKYSKSKWLDINTGGLKFLIDYPTIEQNEKLKELFYEIAFIDNDLLNEDEAVRNNASNSLSPAQLSRLAILTEKIHKLRIKFCVKDWQGVTSEDGKPVKIKLVNDEIEKKQFEALIQNFTYPEIVQIGEMIAREIEFNDADKKK